MLISTDKAVDPVNVLGAPKRLAERVCQARAEPPPTPPATVRAGRALDPPGSVCAPLPGQHRAGGPVSVPATRFVSVFPATTVAPFWASIVPLLVQPLAARRVMLPPETSASIMPWLVNELPVAVLTLGL